MKALEVEDFAAAEETLAQAVRMQPGSAPAHYHGAAPSPASSGLKPAAQEFEATLKLEPGHAGAMMGLAAIDEGTGRLPSAEKRYREVVAISPNPRAQRALASLVGREGRTAEAGSILAALLAANPNDADSRFELALARAIPGGLRGGDPRFRKVLEVQPGRVTALFQLGNWPQPDREGG